MPKNTGTRHANAIPTQTPLKFSPVTAIAPQVKKAIQAAQIPMATEMILAKKAVTSLTKSRSQFTFL